MQPVTTPTQGPTITLKGKQYELKFRLFDLLELWKKYQIDIAQPAGLKGAAALDRVPYMLAAAIAHTGEELTPEEIAKDIDVGDLAVYVEALNEAQKKVSPEAQAAAGRLKAQQLPDGPNGVPAQATD